MKQIKNSEKGFALFEMVLVILILGIALVPMVNLLRSTVTSTAYTQQYGVAAMLAQHRQEAILADYRNTTRGYNYIVANYYYPQVTGVFRNTVTIHPVIKNGITFAEVTVTVTAEMIPDVEVKMWLPQ